MKRMRKAAALLMVLAMVFALAGCGKSDVVGTWHRELDLTEALYKEIDQIHSNIDVKDYVDSFKFEFIYEFKDNGTFTCQIDEAAFDNMLAEYKLEMKAFYTDYVIYYYSDMFAQMGVTEDLSTQKALEAYMGITFEEIYQIIFGMSLDEFIDSSLSVLNIEMMTSLFTEEGKYKTSDGKLYMSAGLEYNVDPECYELYEIQGDVMTVTEGVNMEDIYPYVMEKIA